MRLLIIKSIFVPNAEYIAPNIETIRSFSDYILTMNHRYVVILKLVGYLNPNIEHSKRNEFVQYVLDLERRLNSVREDDDEDNNEDKRSPTILIEHEFWGNNRGKINLLNSMRNIYPMYRLCNFIWYADHDVTPIDNVIQAKDVIGSKLYGREVGVVSLNQEPDNRHNPRVYQNRQTMFELEFYVPENNKDVASGSFITAPKYLAALAELKSRNVYGDEDILIPKKLDRYGLMNIVSDLRVHHPYETNEEYAEWKRAKILDIVTDEETPEIKDDFFE